MKQANFGTSFVYMSPEGVEGSSGGSSSFDSVGDAVAELDRRDQARADETKAAKAAKAAPVAPEADDEQPETDTPLPESDEDEDYDVSDEVTTDDEEKDAPEPEPKADLISIEQDGKKFDVPVELKDAFLRQSDYTRKTQEVASERAQVHAAYQQTAQLAQSLQQQQNQLAQYAQALLGQPPGDEMIQSDPQGYLAQRAAYEQRAGQFQQLMGQGEQLSQHQQMLQEQQNAQNRASEEKSLLDFIPELREPAKRREFADKVSAAVERYGISAHEVMSMMDHRQIRLLKDFSDMADKLKRYEAADKDVKKRLTNVPPRVQRPGTATTDGGQGQQANAAKTQFMKSGKTMKDVARWARQTS